MNSRDFFSRKVITSHTDTNFAAYNKHWLINHTMATNSRWWKVNVKFSVNIFDKGFFLFGSAGIKLVGSFFSATLLVVKMFDFQI